MFRFRPESMSIRANPGLESVFANAGELTNRINPSLFTRIIDPTISFTPIFTQPIAPGIITPGAVGPVSNVPASQSELQALIAAIPIAQDGDVITPDYHNSVRSALIAIAALLLANAAPPPTPTPTPTFTTFPTITLTHTFPTFTLTTFPTFTLTRTFPTLMTKLFQPGAAAEKINELTLMPGIGTAEREALNNAGINDVAGLVNSTPESIAQVLNTDHASAANLIGVARTMQNV